jgi:8-oxo-dGTP diphosphatase
MSKNVIKTERLEIKYPEKKNGMELAELINDHSVVKWLSNVPFPYTFLHAEEFIARSKVKKLKGEAFNFMIFRNKYLIGGIGFSEFKDNSCELGYWLGTKYWGQGFATEAVKGFLREASNELDINEIFAAYKTGNEASKNVLIKCGFEYYGEKMEFDSILQEEVCLTNMVLNNKARRNFQ